MDPRIIDILILIAQHVHGPHPDFTEYEPGRFDSNLDIESVVTSLQEEGYSQGEIDSAVNWFFEQEQARPHFVGKQSTVPPVIGFRLLHPTEQLHISAEAHGFLLQIRQLGIIDDLAVEEVIEHALMTGWPVDLPLMKAVTSSYIFDYSDSNVPVGNWAGFVI